MTVNNDEVRKLIQNLALTDLERLMKFVDVKKLTVCEKRRRQLSIRQIAIGMGINKSTIGNICKTC